MNHLEFKTLRQAVEDVFAALYLIDAGSLTPDQRRQHQESLGAAYLAVVKLENAEFEKLSTKALATLIDLKGSVYSMQAQLSGLKSAAEKLDVLTKGLAVLATIAGLFA